MSTTTIVLLGLLAGLVTGGVVWVFVWGGDSYEIGTAWMSGSLTFLLVGGLAITIPLGIREQNSWEAWCRDQGGHVSSSDTVSTVVGGNGKPGVAVSTTYYCLTVDGRVLDIQ